MKADFLRFGKPTLAILTIALVILTACSTSSSPSSTPTPAYTVNVATSPTLGQYLTDGSGRALYWTTGDSPGTSNVSGAVLTIWPVFYSSSISVPSSLNASDFSYITRTDGSMQTTYKDWPLYYYVGDTAPGDTKGQGLLGPGRWSVVNPAASAPEPAPTPTPQYTVNIATKAAIGSYLVDGTGLSLYYTMRDSPGVSNVPDNLLTTWIPFYASNIAVPSSLNASDFGIITRSNGQQQTTFRGYPLYYYVGDTAPGDTNGQGIGGVWYVVTPANFPPPTPTATPTATPTGLSGY